MIDGLAVVDKPAGMTSHDVVAKCRKIFSQKRVGHAGTLDPDATGVLLVGLGRVTRLLQYVSGADKSYTAEVVLGVTTSTLDATGEVTGRFYMDGVTLSDAQKAAAALTGDIMQIPPMVSALKVGGRRLHALAREGVEVDRQARPVNVSRFDVKWFAEGPPVLEASVECSSGTYVRVLAADLGQLLGGGAHLRNLRRTKVGPWSLDQSVALDSLGVDHLIRAVDAVPWLDMVKLDPATAARVANGAVLDRESVGASGGGPWRLVDPDGDLLAVYQDHGGGLIKPSVVIAQPVT